MGQPLALALLLLRVHHHTSSALEVLSVVVVIVAGAAVDAIAVDHQVAAAIVDLLTANQRIPRILRKTPRKTPRILKILPKTARPKKRATPMKHPAKRMLKDPPGDHGVAAIGHTAMARGVAITALHHRHSVALPVLHSTCPP